jgi:hypothetical protein
VDDPLFPGSRPRRLAPISLNFVPSNCRLSTVSRLLSFNSKSKLYYDRRSAGRSVLVSSRIWGPRPDFCYCQTVTGLFMWDALSDEKTGLSFTTAAGPRQRSHIYRGENH